MVRFLLFVAALAIAGCGASPSTNPSTEEGTACRVYFRPDVLGCARDLPISVMVDSHSGARVSVAGSIKHVDEDWVVLEEKGKHFNSEIWIPRDMVLAIKVLGPPKPQAVQPAVPVDEHEHQPEPDQSAQKDH